MGQRGKVSNPLALAVMALLFERSMHPYEMVSTMRERRKHESVRLKYSSLYSVVGTLEREGLVFREGTIREGRRPERTVYGITATGRAEFLDWLRQLLREPVKEYTRFAAGLSFMAGLPPAEVAGLLGERARLLEEEVREMRSRLDAVVGGGLPRLFVVEAEYDLVLREAELRWVRGLVEEIEAGTLGGIEGWWSFHSQPATAEED